MVEFILWKRLQYLMEFPNNFSETMFVVALQENFVGDLGVF
jgi:hypothetical protein